MNIEEKEQTEKGRSEKQKSSSTAKAERDPEGLQKKIQIGDRGRSRKTLRTEDSRKTRNLESSNQRYQETEDSNKTRNLKSRIIQTRRMILKCTGLQIIFEQTLFNLELLTFNT